MHAFAVIPARYKSIRYPGKPLLMINGKSMISRVYEQVVKSQYINSALVATDDERIQAHCLNANIPVIMTDPTHKSGTDRVAEAVQNIDTDIVVNVQGDEPFILPEYIDLLVDCFDNPEVNISTLVAPCKLEDLEDENIVKAVVDKHGKALYFSRAAIPFRRGSVAKPYPLCHLGMYAFRKYSILTVTQLPQGNLESIEGLEQLRWLEEGWSIYTTEVAAAPISIDTPGDLKKALSWMEENGWT
jgi:3-deoxy-manno-octulosonate cytidylyltransferase (CMP-KDO synthetase)